MEPKASPAAMVLTRRFFATLIVSLSVSACSSRINSEINQMEHLKIRAECRLEEGKLSIAYWVQNITDRSVFLFDIIHRDFNGSEFPIDDGAYIEVSDETIIVSRKLFPVPDNLFVEAKNIPFVTRLLPGASANGRVELQLPLTPRNPYETLDNMKPEAMVLPVQFELGYFLGSEGTERLGRSFPTDRGNLPGFDVFDESSQLLARTGLNAYLPILTDKD